MTTPSQNELDNAIADVEEWRKTGFFRKNLYCGIHIYELLDAAKRSKELEKERDTYFNRLGEHATAILNLEQELSTLRADLKQCAEALKENRVTVSRSGAGHVCVGCGEPFQHPHKDYCLINKALSLPSVQNALKDK